MTQSLLTINWLTQFTHYRRIFVGFSGGLDSTVLLQCLAVEPTLFPKLTAVHVNHGLSPNALVWQEHCQQLCAALQIPLIIKSVEFARQSNIEEVARKARYQVFAQLLEKSDCLVLGHHLNDQAETLLLQLFRGAGIEGLSAMVVEKAFMQGNLLRPFLHYSRQTLENYARLNQLQWIDDESNQDISFSRNYIRHQVLPLLSARWPGIINNLARTSVHCQQAQANLDDLARIDCPALVQVSNQLAIPVFSHLSPARITNILRLWFKTNQVRLPNTVTFNRLINEVIHARQDANPQISWADVNVRRYQQNLYLLKRQVKFSSLVIAWTSFPEPLDLGELGVLCTNVKDKGLIVPPQSKIEIRFRQGGEVFHWHGQSKQLKKLLQEWQIPPWLRDQIPLVFINGQLAAVIGYAISDSFYGTTPIPVYELIINN
ncbi:tRNA lysidine(34) synthetase TilS [Legionella tunisiensis]|uniref:tRNA lysidine(34) synthetase TilS n=1 Tax=Legionella tunisiensis TaxID=1034944 RepID=UPI000375A13C|nr:tRNA lysidine(34) synthetase TilS [Legionella tunisiensis]